MHSYTTISPCSDNIVEQLMYMYMYTNVYVFVTTLLLLYIPLSAYDSFDYVLCSYVHNYKRLIIL